jgi:glycosyltransferase involved in cell wall biosynthesis
MSDQSDCVVVQVVQHLSPGGIETMALDLQAFRSVGERTHVISLEGSKAEALSRWPRLQPFADWLVFLDKRPGLQPTLVMSLRRLLRDLRADVVHTHHVGPLIYGGLAARLAGVKHLVHTEHDAWHLDDPRRRRLQRLILTLTRPTLVADADAVAAGVRQHLHRDQVLVIRNGIDTQRFRPADKCTARGELGLPQDVRLIGCAGRLEPVKGQDVLLDALHQLPSDVHLALAGSGSTEQALRRQVDDLKLSERVHFLGRIDDMPGFYQALDVFCLPSRREGMPLSPLEAQACGVPALVTATGGSREAVCPHTGVLVPRGDALAMADALERLLSAPPTLSPRTFVEREADVRNMARAYAALRTPIHCSGA